MENKDEILYQLKPNYDFIYEMTMPTGKKVRGKIFVAILALVLMIVIIVSKKYVIGLNNDIAMKGYNVVLVLSIIFFIISLIAIAVRIVAQIYEYKGMTYSFYNNHMVVENNFLNQSKKTIEYNNIKEIEIRKNITDRMLKYGIIIIHTNADKARGSATVIYAIKNIDEHYAKIESIIHNGKLPEEEVSKNEEIKKDEEVKEEQEKQIDTNEINNDTKTEDDSEEKIMDDNVIRE